MRDILNNISVADLSDSLLDLGSLRLLTESKGSVAARTENEATYSATDDDDNGVKCSIDASNEDVLLVGTNIKVKSDIDEGNDEVVMELKPSDFIKTENAAKQYGYGNIVLEELPSDCLHSSYTNGSSDYHQGGMAEGCAINGSSDYGSSHNKTGIKGSSSAKNDPKQETGFLLNYFRGKGAKATLKSIVNGKPACDKVVDLDAENSSSREVPDDKEEIQQIYLSRPNQPGPNCGGITSASASCHRRNLARGYRKEQVYNPYAESIMYPNHAMVGLGRVEHNQLVPENIQGLDGSTFYPSDKQPMTPDLFNGWVRVLFNVVVTTVLLYLGMMFILAVSRDIGNGLEKRRQMVKAEAMLCQELYRKNKCRTVDVPALEHQCREWEACMYKDAILYEDTSFLSAEVLGGVINKFVSQLDARTVGIVIAAFLALFVGSNCALSMSSNPRPPSQGWFRRWFSRGSPPPNGSDILGNGQHAASTGMFQAVRNPYMQPNYCTMASYPYTNFTGYAPANGHPSSVYYGDHQNSETGSQGRSGRTSAWKRRFLSPWVDQR